MKVSAHTGFTAKEVQRSRSHPSSLIPSPLPDQVSTQVMRFLLQNQGPPWALALDL